MNQQAGFDELEMTTCLVTGWDATGTIYLSHMRRRWSDPGWCLGADV